MADTNSKRNKILISGDGFEGEKTEITLENYVAYFSKVTTKKEIELRVDGADNWLQFHFQLSGRTNTVLVKENRDICIEPNTFTILYQKKGSCLIQFPRNSRYQSFGFRADPEFFSNSFLKDFGELSSIKEAILNQKMFHLDKTFSSLDLKTREIISTIINNPFEGPMEEAFVENKIVELIFYSIPELRKRNQQSIASNENFEEEIQKAKTFIDNNIDKKLSIERIARISGLNQYTLKTKFKEYIGQSVIDYYIESKLKRAYHDIQDTNKKITSIAYETGYSSVGNFSNAFLKRYGFRPSRLRKPAKGQ
ncbi:MAG: AraC family transcriptional regulator [Bacteroidota bacterium]